MATLVKALISQKALVLFLLVLTACNTSTNNHSSFPISTVDSLPTSTLVIESTTTPSDQTIGTSTRMPAETAIPTLNNRTTVDIGNGLSWTECVLPYRDYFHTKADGALITDCLGMEFPNESIERDSYAQRVPGDALEDFRLNFEGVAYEAKGTWHPQKLDYELFKNGAVIARADARFYTFDPNRSLRIIGDAVVWELISEPPVIFVYGVNFNEKYHLDGSFFPHSINDKLIYIAKKGNQFQIVYDEQALGPKFDEISMAYCCAKFSVIEGHEQYWFLGRRNDIQYAIAIFTGTH